MISKHKNNTIDGIGQGSDLTFSVVGLLSVVIRYDLFTQSKDLICYCG